MSPTPILDKRKSTVQHYGALQGLNKAETAKKFGEAQVKLWRRSYDICPPALEEDDPRHPRHDSRYRSLRPEEIPATECLKDPMERVMRCWHERIAPQVSTGIPLVYELDEHLKPIRHYYLGESQPRPGTINR